MLSDTDQESGDLGLGHGYKPGGIPLHELYDEGSVDYVDLEDSCLDDEELSSYLSSANGFSKTSSSECTLPSAGRNGFLLAKLSKTLDRSKSHETNDIAKTKRKHFSKSKNRFHAFTSLQPQKNVTEPCLGYEDTKSGIRFGSSISQQKRLFLHEIKELFPANCKPHKPGLFIQL